MPTSSQNYLIFFANLPIRVRGQKAYTDGHTDIMVDNAAVLLCKEYSIISKSFCKVLYFWVTSCNSKRLLTDLLMDMPTDIVVLKDCTERVFVLWSKVPIWFNRVCECISGVVSRSSFFLDSRIRIQGFFSRRSDPVHLHPDPVPSTLIYPDSTSITYCMSKKSWPNLHSYLSYKMGQDNRQTVYWRLEKS